MIGDLIKRIIKKRNIYIRKYKHLPYGTDLCVDMNRIYDSKKIKVVFDVGANIGQSASWFREIFPNSDIYSFEPIKSTFKLMEEKFNDDSQVLSFNFALGSEVGEREIQLQDDHQWNSLNLDVNNLVHCNGHNEKVEIIVIDDFMFENNIKHIGLLKIDTEGYEA